MKAHAIIFICVAAVMTACSGGNAGKEDPVATDSLPGAAYLTMTPRDGYTEVTVADPWRAGGTLGRYALVPRGADVAVPDSLVPVKVPLERSVVYSMVHTSVFDELGHISAVAGVADGSYFAPDDTVTALLASGRIADVGSSMSPSIEKIIELQPDAIILSPMESQQPATLDATGIPVIYMADYMERTPTGRAEWMRLVGALTGSEARADSIYDAVRRDYAALRAEASAAATRPTVISERPYDGVWYVPGGGSYKAAMFADAGACYPWSDDTSTGSLQLSEEAVIARGGNAAVWLLNEQGECSPEALTEAMPHARAFAAYPEGVYYCNVSVSPLYRDIAFHPERVLADMIYIFHPELRGDRTLRYYRPLKK